MSKVDWLRREEEMSKADVINNMMEEARRAEERIAEMERRLRAHGHSGDCTGRPCFCGLSPLLEDRPWNGAEKAAHRRLLEWWWNAGNVDGVRRSLERLGDRWPERLDRLPDMRRTEARYAAAFCKRCEAHSGHGLKLLTREQATVHGVACPECGDSVVLDDDYAVLPLAVSSEESE